MLMKIIELIGLYKAILFGAVIGIFLFNIASCKSVEDKAGKPMDLRPLINEVENSKELENSPELKQRISNSLNECQDYSKRVYSLYISYAEENSKFLEEIKELEEELKPWRTIKRVGYTALGVILVFAILWFISKFRGITI